MLLKLLGKRAAIPLGLVEAAGEASIGRTTA